MEIKNPHNAPPEVDEQAVRDSDPAVLSVRSDLQKGRVVVLLGNTPVFTMAPSDATKFATHVHQRSAAIRKYQRHKKGGV